MWFRLLRREVEFQRDAELGILPDGDPEGPGGRGEPEGAGEAGPRDQDPASTPVR